MIALAVMALPLRLVWDLRIDRKQKTGLAGIFLLGLVDVIFAIVRVVETSASAHHVDVVWLGLWSMIEASVCELSAIVGSSLNPSADII